MPSGVVEEGDLRGLVDRFREGDREAFGQLWRQIGWRLQAYLAARCRPPLDAESLAQDVWISAFQHRGKFDGANFQGWVFQIAKRKLIDAARRKRPDLLPDDYDPAERDADDHDDRPVQFLRECAGLLPEPFKSTIVFLLRGMKPDEIATTMNVPRQTIDTRKYRALAQLKDCVDRKSTG